MTGHTYFRSIAFGIALIFALWLIVGAWLSDAEPIPRPDGYLLAAIAAWAGWSAASMLWSIHPDYTRSELGTEIVWGLATATIFYVAVRTCGRVSGTAHDGDRDLRGARGAGRRRAARRRRGGHRACARPLARRRGRLLDLPRARDPAVAAAAAAAPERIRQPCAGRRVIALAILALLLFAARLTENRMVWIALAAAARAGGRPLRLALAAPARPRPVALDGDAARAAAGPRRALHRRGRTSRAHRLRTRCPRRQHAHRRSALRAVDAHVRTHPRTTLARLRIRQVDPARRAARYARQSDARARAQPVRQPVGADRRHRRAHAGRPAGRARVALRRVRAVRRRHAGGARASAVSRCWRHSSSRT